MMRHVITRRLVGPQRQVEITEQQFHDIRDAKNLLLHALFIETKYDLVLSNYAAMERHLLTRALDSILFSDDSPSGFIGGINEVNLTLVNLLTTCRLYLDQTTHHLRQMFGFSSDAEETFQNTRHEQYDNVLGYRVLEAMRNYVQHRGYPIHMISIDNCWDDEREYSRCKIVPFTQIDMIREDKGFKARVLQEMEGRADEKGRLDLRPLVREYISCLGKVHFAIRSAIERNCTEAETILRAAITTYQSTADEKAVGLAAVAIDDQEAFTEEVGIYVDNFEHRHMLIGKNRYAVFAAL